MECSRKVIFILIALLLTFFGCAVPSTSVSELMESTDPPYLNPDLPLETRVSDIVSRMTLEEKIGQMNYEAPAIERLGIPAYNWWNEALHGVARAGHATVFPQAIGLAATWDEDLLFRVASVISEEARAKYHEFQRRGKRGIYQGLTFWSPNINLFRDPRWGRGMETYGEDPFLTGRLGVAFVKGLQGDDPKYFKAIATPKHFAVHSGPEPDRHNFDARVSERDLRETYLPHFRDCVVEGRAYSVMCAYNRFMGDPCCGSSRLLNTILRDEWGFEGYVVSDCWAVHDFWERHKTSASPEEATALSVRSGTDLECGASFQNLLPAVKLGLVDEAAIDQAVRRLFTARMKLGMFDPPEKVPYASIPFEKNDCAEHDALALETAVKSIVLLKNDGILPLSRDIGTVAVIGPNADDVDVLVGNYNGTPSRPVTPLEGIRKKLAGARVLYAQGCDPAPNLYLARNIPSSCLRTEGNEQGLTGEYFANGEWQGEPVFARVDTSIRFDWGQSTPDPRLEDDRYSVRWTGYLIPPETGEYELGGQAFNWQRIRLEDSLLVDSKNRHQASLETRTVTLEKGKKYRIVAEFADYHNDAWIRLVWARHGADHIAQALRTAQKADAVILVMGLSPRLEGEEMPVQVPGYSGGDRYTLDLPDPQIELMRAIHGLGKPTVLVLLSGSCVAVNWAAEHIPAILQAWYPGQRGGDAISDVLFGDANPAGRLPVTFYKSLDQIPGFSDYVMTGKTYRYFTDEPLYPFGYGLSYTRFHYSDLQVPGTIGPDEPLKIVFRIQNTGPRDGDEVVQIYLSHENEGGPIRSLKAFRRIHLKAGEFRTVEMTVPRYHLAVIREDGSRWIIPGTVTVSVGGQQPGFSGRTHAGSTEVHIRSFVIAGPEVLIEP